MARKSNLPVRPVRDPLWQAVRDARKAVKKSAKFLAMQTQAHLDALKDLEKREIALEEFDLRNRVAPPVEPVPIIEGDKP